MIETFDKGVIEQGKVLQSPEKPSLEDLVLLLQQPETAQALAQHIGITPDQAQRVQQYYLDFLSKPRSTSTPEVLETTSTVSELAQAEVIDSPEVPSYISHITSMAYDALQEAESTVTFRRDPTQATGWSTERNQARGYSKIFDLAPKGEDNHLALKASVDRTRNTVTMSGVIEGQFATMDRSGRNNAIGFRLTFNNATEMNSFLNDLQSSGTDALVDTLNNVYQQVMPDNSTVFAHRGTLRKGYKNGPFIFSNREGPRVVRGAVLMTRLDLEDGGNKKSTSFLKKEQALALD